MGDLIYFFTVIYIKNVKFFMNLRILYVLLFGAKFENFCHTFTKIKVNKG